MDIRYNYCSSQENLDIITYLLSAPIQSQALAQKPKEKPRLSWSVRDSNMPTANKPRFRYGNFSPGFQLLQDTSVCASDSISTFI